MKAFETAAGLLVLLRLVCIVDLRLNTSCHIRSLKHQKATVFSYKGQRHPKEHPTGFCWFLTTLTATLIWKMASLELSHHCLLLPWAGIGLIYTRSWVGAEPGQLTQGIVHTIFQIMWHHTQYITGGARQEEEGSQIKNRLSIMLWVANNCTVHHSLHRYCFISVVISSSFMLSNLTVLISRKGYLFVPIVLLIPPGQGGVSKQSLEA